MISGCPLSLGERSTPDGNSSVRLLSIYQVTAKRTARGCARAVMIPTRCPNRAYHPGIWDVRENWMYPSTFDLVHRTLSGMYLLGQWSTWCQPGMAHQGICQSPGWRTSVSWASLIEDVPDCCLLDQFDQPERYDLVDGLSTDLPANQQEQCIANAEASFDLVITGFTHKMLRTILPMPFNHFDIISPIYERFGRFDRSHPMLDVVGTPSKRAGGRYRRRHRPGCTKLSRRAAARWSSWMCPPAC